MRILMLGNSFIFTNNMPQMLADLTGAEVVHHLSLIHICALFPHEPVYSPTRCHRKAQPQSNGR